MNRILKVLGTAMVAALALSVMASAAQAVNFTAEEEPASFHGENGFGNEVFTTEAGSVECDSTFSGEGSKSPTITAIPVYTNCEAFGFVDADVDMTSCAYTFHLESDLGGDKYTALVTIECEDEGDAIDITALSCSATVAPQGSLSHVILNDTTNGIIHVEAAVSDIDYTVTKDGFLCPFSGTGAKEGGEYNSEEPVAIGSEQGIHIG